MGRTDNSLASAHKVGDLFGKQYKTKDFVGRSDRFDFYQFVLSQSVDFSLSFKKSRASAIAKVDLLNSTGTVIISSGKQNKILGELGAGTYYIRVKSVKGNSNYSLTTSASLAEPGEVAGTERNLNILTGNLSLTEGVGSDDDKDYYKFSLAQIGDFSATLTGLSQPAYMVLYRDANANGAIDPSDTQITYVSGSSTTNGNIAATLPTGTYFIELDYNGGSSNSTQYRIDITQAARPGNLSSDPGPSTPYPATFPGNFVDLVGSLDDKDYYKFTFNQISDFSATLTGLSQSTYMTLYRDANANGIIDSNDTQITYATGSNAKSATISATLPADSYLIELDYNGSSINNTRYELSLSQTSRPGNISPDPTALAPYSVSSFPTTLIDLVGSLDDKDYYKFTINQQSNLNATLSNLSQSAYLVLYRDANGNNLIDGNDSQITYSSGSSTVSANILRSLSTGTYFVEVDYNGSGGNNTRYELTLGLG